MIGKFFNNEHKKTLEKILKKLYMENKEKRRIFEDDLYINYTVYRDIYNDYLNKIDKIDIDFFLLYLHYSNNISLQHYRIEELIKKYSLTGGYQQKHLKYKNKLLQLK